MTEEQFKKLHVGDFVRPKYDGYKNRALKVVCTNDREGLVETDDKDYMFVSGTNSNKVFRFENLIALQAPYYAVIPE
jgi:hypothetical protein